MILLRDLRWRFAMPVVGCLLSGFVYHQNKKRKERKADEEVLEDCGHNNSSDHMDHEPVADDEFPFERWRKLHADGEGI